VELVDIVEEHKKIEVVLLVVDDTFVVASFAVVVEDMLPEEVELVANDLNKTLIDQIYKQKDIGYLL
jgi:hypothetical protein